MAASIKSGVSFEIECEPCNSGSIIHVDKIHIDRHNMEKIGLVLRKLTGTRNYPHMDPLSIRSKPMGEIDMLLPSFIWSSVVGQERTIGCSYNGNLS